MNSRLSRPVGQFVYVSTALRFYSHFSSGTPYDSIDACQNEIAQCDYSKALNSISIGPSSVGPQLTLYSFSISLLEEFSIISTFRS